MRLIILVVVGLVGCAATTDAPCDAVELDLGDVRVGDVATQTVTLENVLPGPAPVYVAPLDAPFETDVQGAVPLESGATRAVTVRFSPREAGLIERTWAVRPRTDCGVTTFTLRGLGVGDAFSVSPARVDFGAVATTATRTVTVHNYTRSALELSVVSRDARFVATPGLLGVPALGEAVFELRASASDATPVEASVEVGGVVVPVVMNRATPCLQASTSALALGAAEVGCATRDATVTLTNTCAEPLQVVEVVTASPAFQVVAVPSMTLGAHAAMDVHFALRPEVRGRLATAAQVRVSVGGVEQVTELTLSGEGLATSTFRDEWALPDLSLPGELLLVVDDTRAMHAQREQVEANLERARLVFSASFPALRVGALTAEAGAPLRGVVDGASASAFAALTAVRGAQQAPVSCLDALTDFARAGLAGFHRPGALLFVVCVTANDDASVAPRGPLLDELVRLLPGRASVHVVGQGPSCGGRFGGLAQLAESTWGLTFDLCEADWGSELRFAIPVWGCFGPNVRFRLSTVPDFTRAPLVVRVGGQVLAQSEHWWSWDAVDNAVVLEPLVLQPNVTLSVEGVGACR